MHRGQEEPCTLVVSASNVNCFSAWIIFPTKSQWWRRCSRREEFLVSKQDVIMFSTWWCKKLLYGYLPHSEIVARHEIKWQSTRYQNCKTYSKNKCIILCTAPRSINFFSAASPPTVTRTDMNSTIWKNKCSVNITYGKATILLFNILKEQQIWKKAITCESTFMTAHVQN